MYSLNFKKLCFMVLFFHQQLAVVAALVAVVSCVGPYGRPYAAAPYRSYPAAGYGYAPSYDYVSFLF